MNIIYVAVSKIAGGSKDPPHSNIGPSLFEYVLKEDGIKSVMRGIW